MGLGKFSTAGIADAEQQAHDEAREAAKQASKDRIFLPAYLKGDCPLPMYKFTEAGPVVLDILPMKVSQTDPLFGKKEFNYARKFQVHRNWKPLTGAFHLCVDRTFNTGQRCLLCKDAFGELKGYPDKDDPARKVIIGRLSKDRQLYFVTSPEWEEDPVRILDMPYFTMGKVIDATVAALDLSDEEEAAQAAFIDPTAGFSLKLTVEMDSFNGNEFPKVAAVGFKKRKSQYGEDIIDRLPDVDSLFKIPTADDQQAVVDAHYGRQAAAAQEETPETSDEGDWENFTS